MTVTAAFVCPPVETTPVDLPAALKVARPSLSPFRFAVLAIGDRLAVPVNSDPPRRVWARVADAARTHRDRHAPGFEWVLCTIPGYVVLIRVDPAMPMGERLALSRGILGEHTALFRRIRRHTDAHQAHVAAMRASEGRRA